MNEKKRTLDLDRQTRLYLLNSPLALMLYLSSSNKHALPLCVFREREMSQPNGKKSAD